MALFLSLSFLAGRSPVLCLLRRVRFLSCSILSVFLSGSRRPVRFCPTVRMPCPADRRPCPAAFISSSFTSMASRPRTPPSGSASFFRRLRHTPSTGPPSRGTRPLHADPRRSWLIGHPWKGCCTGRRRLPDPPETQVSHSRSTSSDICPSWERWPRCTNRFPITCHDSASCCMAAWLVLSMTS